ncbi:MAG: ABC transporter substrate-binding protein [Bacteroidetes bacterium]|nr:ABC transporter substrate-binding protein [Bacteroidota bacterium]
MKNPLFILISATLVLASCSKKNTTSHSLREGKGGKKLGGTLNVNETGDLRSLDPPQINDQTSNHIGENIYDRLLEFDNNLNVKPCLAKALPDISPDGLTYTFHLRTDVFFQDDACFPNGKGRKMVAKDIVYCFTRAVDPSTNTLALPYFQVIKGAKEYFDSKATLAGGVSGLAAPDDSTFVVTLTAPFSPFINYPLLGCSFIYPHEAVEKYGKDFTHHGVGTGPYRFVDYKEGQYCLLTRNEHYWQADKDGNRLPYIDSVKFRFIQDDKSELLEFKAGKLDHKYRLPNEFFNDIVDEHKELKGDYKKYTLGRIAALATQFHGFNTVYPGVSNVHLRRAISFAIDRKKIVKYILKGQAFAPGEHGLVPPGMPGYPFDQIQGFVFNPDSAKNELELAKKELNGQMPELTLYVNKGGGRNQDVAQAVQAQIKENLGLDVKLEIKEWSQLTPMIDDGKAAYFRLGWVADYPDPQNFLNLLYGKNIPPSGPSSINQTRFRNDEFDRTYEAAIAETDRAKALQLWAKCDQIAIASAPQVILYYDEDYHLMQPWVKDFPINAQDNNPFKLTWFSE